MSRALPHDLEAERAVVGGLMLDPHPDMVADVRSVLRAADFYREIHGHLYTLILKMRDDDRPTAMVDVVQEAAKGHRIAAVYGGLSYISDLPDNVPSTENIDWYAGLIREAREKRDLLHSILEQAQRLTEESATAADVRDTLAELASVDAPTGAVRDIGLVAQGVYDDLSAEAAGTKVVYLPSGLDELDSDYDHGGISAEGTTLVIGASGMGKTSLINRLALGMAHEGYRVCLYGTETSPERRTRDIKMTLAAIDGRLWATTARMQRHAVQQGHTAPHAAAKLQGWLSRFQAATIRLGQLPIRVFNSGMTVDDLCQKITQQYRQGRCDVAVIDYLQDLVFSRLVPQKFGPQVSYSSKRLKDLSARLGIPIVIGAQRRNELTLNIDDHNQLIPVHAQHASSAFHDAEEVYALYRADYYRERYPDKNFKGPHGEIQLVARKRRTGRLSSWDLSFHGPTKWVGSRPMGLDLSARLQAAK